MKKPLKVGDRIEVFKTIVQPHDWYAPKGTWFAAIEVTDRFVFPGKICKYNDTYYYYGSEAVKVACLKITKVK